jgi:hypothetical protein
MSQQLEAIIERIRQERQRQLDLPGSEWDRKNTPGDWVAIVNHYVARDVRRNGVVPEREGFEDSLIKAAAVIIAALEHTDIMDNREQLR